jgi:hypothetical protein
MLSGRRRDALERLDELAAKRREIFGDMTGVVARENDAPQRLLELQRARTAHTEALVAEEEEALYGEKQ